MAETIFETDNALTRKAWTEKLLRSAKKNTFWNMYMAEGGDNIVHVKNELAKEQGDKVTFGLRAQLAGAGQTGDDYLEGKEESIVTYSDAVTLEQYRHGVRVKGRLSMKRAVFSIEEEQKVALREWAESKVDNLCTDAIVASPTRVCYPVGASATFTVATGGSAGATAAAAINATQSAPTPKFFTQLKTYAKTGGNSRFERLKPLKIEGKEYLVALVPEDVLNDLFNNTEMMNAHKDARERGSSNPLFQSADIVYNGVLIKGYEKMPTQANGSSVNYGKCVLLGKQALVWAWGRKEEFVQETFDYKNQIGYAWGIIAGVKKPQFNSEDFGSLGFYLSCTNISNA